MYGIKINKKMRYFFLFISVLITPYFYSQENTVKENKVTNAPASPLNSEVKEGYLEVDKSEKKASTYRNSYSEAQTVDQLKKIELQATYGRTQRNPSMLQQAQIEALVLELEKSNKKSFEYHYYKYLSGNYNIDWVDHLLEAQKLKPKNADVITQLVAYNFIKGNTSNCISNLKELHSLGRLDDVALTYTTDVLISVPQNGLLFTHGFDDTYGALYMQKVSGIRTDVKIISLDFLQSSFYREKLVKEGVRLPEQSLINGRYLKEICELNPSKSLALSLTIPKEYFVEIKSNTYVTGLVMEYHKDDFNNYYRNDFLWNSELTNELVDNANSQKAKELSSNYLPMLLLLRKTYQKVNDYQALEKIDKAIDKVAVQCDKYEQVSRIKGSY